MNVGVMQAKSHTFVVSVGRLLVSRQISSPTVANTPALNLSRVNTVPERSNARFDLRCIHILVVIESSNYNRRTVYLLTLIATSNSSRPGISGVF